MTRRAVNIPLDHLDAELLAAPFADEAAFTSAPIALDPTLRHDPTRRLWRSTEQRLAAAFPSLSLDELIARRDRVWFPAGPRHRAPLAEVLRGISRHLARDGVDGAAPAAQRRRMRWLSFALPRDLVEVFTDASAPPAPSVTPIISRLLAQGVVEPHLHLGAALDFETIWIAVQYTLAADGSRAELFASPGACFDEGRALAPWLLRGLIARAVLASFLMTRDDISQFEPWLKRKLRRLPPADGYALGRVIIALRNGRPTPGESFDRLRALYRFLVGIGPGRATLPKDLDAIRAADGIAGWFPVSSAASSEQRYLRCAVTRMDRSGRDHSDFNMLLWQTIRLRVMLYRHLVQRPLVGGLQWFTRSFARIGPVRGPIDSKALVQSAERLGGVELASIELRFKPVTPQANLEDQLRHIGAAAQRPVGLILHLSRSRSRAHARGAPAAFGEGSHGQPTAGQPFRHGLFYRARLAEAQAIIDLLRTRPHAIEWLRGIDVCGDELGVPLWVIAPLLTEIRRVGRLAAERFARKRCAGTAPRLMVHAGEDYVHLLGGLRRIDEFIEHLELGEGDRIAHALALGEDVARWCGSAAGRVQGREERLLDLLWVWRRLRHEPSSELATWGTWLEAQLRALIQHLFGAEHAIEAIDAAHRHLFDGMSLRRMGFPTDPHCILSGDDTLVLARRWLTDRGVFRRGQELEEVEPQRIAPLIESMQRRVRRRLSERSVVIEINPSSNLLVGAFSDLGHHPLWRLRPVEPDGHPSVMVCIGSDDPITFATRLPEEYQLVHDTLVEAGVSSDKALAWLDEARRVSLLSSVSLPTALVAPPHRRRWPEALDPIPRRTLPA